MRREAHRYSDSESGRELIDARGAGQPWFNQQRAQLYRLAEYYAWSARKGFRDPGADRLGASDYLSRMIGRASDAAAARVCYQQARKCAGPLERMEATVR